MAKAVSVSVLGITEFGDQEFVNKKLDKVLGKLGDSVKDVVTTSDKGAMKAAREYCEENTVKCRVIQLDWDGEGKAARPKANEKAIMDSRVVVIFWDKKCPYVKDLIDRALKLRRTLKIFVKED